jgi:hypothetical protein
VERVEDERAVEAADRHESLTIAQRELGDRDAPGRLERLLEERVRLRRGLLRLEVVRGLDVELLRDLVLLDEARDVDRLARAQRQLLEVLVVELDVAALLVLVRPDDVVPRDLVIALGQKRLFLMRALCSGQRRLNETLLELSVAR